MSVYPGMFAIAGAILMAFYPLNINKKKMANIESELVERRKQYQYD